MFTKVVCILELDDLHTDPGLKEQHAIGFPVARSFNLIHDLHHNSNSQLQFTFQHPTMQ